MNDNVKRYRRTALPLSRLVEEETKPLMKKHGLVAARIITEWEKIAGKTLAKHSLPTRIRFPKGQKREGTLYVTVAPGWAPEIQHLTPLILEKIAIYFGYRAVESLKLTTAPLPQSNEKAQYRTLPPLPAKDAASISTSLAHVEDAELRATLQHYAEMRAREKTNHPVKK